VEMQKGGALPLLVCRDVAWSQIAAALYCLRAIVPSASPRPFSAVVKTLFR
jgi:hypothetical protein